MADLLQILQHARGADQYGRHESKRNHFVTGEGCPDHSLCMEAVDKGLMVRRAGNALSGGDDIFIVTEAGKDFIRDNSPAPPKLTAGQRRYKAYLQSDSTLTFGQWMKQGRANHG